MVVKHNKEFSGSPVELATKSNENDVTNPRNAKRTKSKIGKRVLIQKASESKLQIEETKEER